MLAAFLPGFAGLGMAMLIGLAAGTVATPTAAHVVVPLATTANLVTAGVYSGG